MIPIDVLNRYAAILKNLELSSRDAVTKATSKLGVDKKAHARAMVAIMTPYTDASAMVTSRVYKGIAENAGKSVKVTSYNSISADDIESAVYSIMNGATPANMDKRLNMLANWASYAIRKAAGDNMFANGGPETRYMRLPMGSETCEFCIMLASRGAVYRSRETAGYLNHYHANCDCLVVPVIDGNYPEGYDQQVWLDKYQQLIDDGKIKMGQFSKKQRERQATKPRSKADWVAWVKDSVDLEEAERRFKVFQRDSGLKGYPKEDALRQIWAWSNATWPNRGK